MSNVEKPIDVVKQFIANFERKQRNLLKRKVKLDTYRDQLSKGNTLSEEQKKAVEGYEGVLQSLVVVQEVLSQSKDLVGDVEKCIKVEEKKKEADYEEFTVSFLHTQISLLRLLYSLDKPEVRAAVLRASSENNLKLLENVRQLVLPQFSESWPSSCTTAVSSFQTFLQSNPEVTSCSQHTLNLVLGRHVPLPLAEGYEGSQKKCNFKEARNLCFRLLSTPAVRQSIEQPSFSKPISPVPQEIPEPLVVTNEISHPDLSHPEETHILGEVPVDHHIQDTEPLHADHSAPLTMLDEVIKPLGGTFNFLQASSVMAPAPILDAPAPVIEVAPEPIDSHSLTDSAIIYATQPNGCYSQPSPSHTPEVTYTIPPKEDIYKHVDPEINTIGQRECSPATSADVSAPTKPMSYADLVRRSGVNRTTHHEVNSSVIHQDVHKHEPSAPDSHTDAESTRPNFNRGGRGFNRGYARGNQGGPSRRPMGGARFNRIGSGAGRGAGGYRGAPAGVMQSSY